MVGPVGGLQREVLGGVVAAGAAQQGDHVAGDVRAHCRVVRLAGCGECPVGGQPVQPGYLELDADMDGSVVQLGGHRRLACTAVHGGQQARQPGSKRAVPAGLEVGADTGEPGAQPGRADRGSGAGTAQEDSLQPGDQLAGRITGSVGGGRAGGEQGHRGQAGKPAQQLAASHRAVTALPWPITGLSCRHFIGGARDPGGYHAGLGKPEQPERDTEFGGEPAQHGQRPVAGFHP